VIPSTQQGSTRAEPAGTSIDRVMLGSDYCFDMGYERPREIIDALKLSAADRDRIYPGNAARVLGL